MATYAAAGTRGVSSQTVMWSKVALGEAVVKIIDNKKTFMGRGVSTDIIEASAKAYINAINRLVTV